MDEKHNDIDEGNQEQWELFEVRKDKFSFYEKELLPIAPLPILSLKELHGEQLRTIAKGIAMIVLDAFGSINWRYLKDYGEVNPKVLHYAQRMVFKSFTNFVLNIFDIEDFQRIVEHQMINKNCRDFYDVLCKDFDCCSKPDFSAMDAISKGSMNVKGFPFLWDRDVNYILGEFGPIVEYALVQDIVVYDHYVRTVLDAIQEHMPLEKEQKLDLKMAYITSLDAWRDINFEELEKLGFGDVGYLDRAMHHAFNLLANLKANLLNKSNKWATFPLTCGVFGRFTKEVVEVVGIANLERMWLGQRFLSVYHILSGFSRSIIADNVDKFIKEWPNPISRDLEETSPIYYIYEASRDVACVLGSDTIELEHLFLATFFGNRKGIDENKWNEIVRLEVVAEFLKESINNKYSEDQPKKRKIEAA